MWTSYPQEPILRTPCPSCNSTAIGKQQGRPIESEKMTELMEVIASEAIDGLNEPEAFRVWLNYASLEEPLSMDNLSEVYETFEEQYAGQFFSTREFGEEMSDQFGLLGDVPDSIAYYFDFESWGRDLLIGGDYWEADTYYFRSY